MTFKKYHSLNNVSQKLIDLLQVQGLTEGEFVALEKAHGANFSLIFDTDTADITAARRGAQLENRENFHSAQKLIQAYTARLTTLISDLLVNSDYIHAAGDKVYLRCEVVGGMFQGKSAEGASRVQKEVEYCAHNDILAFGLEIHSEDTIYHVPYDTFNNLCSNYGIPQAPEMGRGTLTEMLALPNDFDSVIPKVFGNPVIEGNTTEGLVIAPVGDATFMSNGTRVILKSKNSKFSENKGTRIKTGKGTALSDEAKVAGEDLTQYFTEQRISNLVSKEKVPESWKDFPRYGGLLFQDALQDYEQDTDTVLKEKFEDEWKAMVRVYKTISDKLLREYFKETL